MEDKTNPEKQPPAPKKGMSDFRKAFLWTGIPIVVLGLLTVVGRAVSGYYIGILVVPPLWVIAIFVCIGFAIARKRQIATGMLAGIALGIVGVGLSCFASF